MDQSVSFPSVPVMGYQVYKGGLGQLDLTGKKTVINTLNAYSYVLAEKNQHFSDALKASDILVADGFPIVLAARILGRFKIKKIAGYDVFRHLLGILNKCSGSCYFFGSSNQTLQSIEKKLGNEFPDVDAAFYSPPFKDTFTEEENLEMINMINDFHPDVLFVGMTAPKQERWVFENRSLIKANIICSIGAVFDFYAGTVLRPSHFWVRLGLEWFIRFVKEPKRLWRRYFIYSPIFIKYLIIYALKSDRHQE